MTTYHLFDESPALAATADSGALSLGTEFYVTATSWLTELRYLQPATGGTPTRRTAALYTTTNGITGTLVAGPLLLPVPVDGEWVTGVLPSPVSLVPNTRYRVVIFHPDGQYSATSHYFDGGAEDKVSGPLVVPKQANSLSLNQGSYKYDSWIEFPDAQFQGTSYYSDAGITDVDPALPPPVVEADVSLGVSAPSGNGLSVFYIPNTSLTVSAARGNGLTTSEAKL